MRRSIRKKRALLFGLALLLLIALVSCRRQPPDPPRVAEARNQRGAEVKRLCRAAGVSYPPAALFFRVFKKEGVLECWGHNRWDTTFRLIKSFPVLASSGQPGPKRREGDLQVPEGFYQIDLFNPDSSFHLSMRVNYPNASDQILSDKDHPGFDIYVHGGCNSVGCMPVGDDGIEELYLIAADATETGQRGPIPIHIFPARMNGPEWERFRHEQTAAKPELAAFWDGLKPGFDSFEKTHRLPTVTVDVEGKYGLASP